MDPQNFTFIDLFAGIGGIRIAFEKVGGHCVWSCDSDPDVQLMYKENFEETPVGDIYKISNDEIPDHDILLAGFPCPTYSIIGNRKGIHNITGGLFFEITRILRDKQPHAFLLENVKGLSSVYKGKLLEMMIYLLKNCGYSVQWKLLNALDFGLPQNRERVVIVGFKKNYKFTWPKRQIKRLTLKDILESEESVDKFYFASEHIKKRREDAVKNKKVFYPSIWHENKSGNISILPFSCALRANASYNYLLVNGIRRLTPREMLRLQGFPDSFKTVGNYTTLRKLIGNSVPVPMIEAVAKQMIKSIIEDQIVKYEEIKQIKLEEMMSERI